MQGSLWGGRVCQPSLAHQAVWHWELNLVAPLPPAGGKQGKAKQASDGSQPQVLRPGDSSRGCGLGKVCRGCGLGTAVVGGTVWHNYSKNLRP